jgi:hypothetical protein
VFAITQSISDDRGDREFVVYLLQKAI